jgi:hypothetical protein
MANQSGRSVHIGQEALEQIEQRHSERFGADAPDIPLTVTIARLVTEDE